MSTSTPIQSRPIVPHISSFCSQCHAAFEFPAPSPHPKPGTLLSVACFQCNSIHSHAFYPNQLPASASSPSGSHVGAGTAPSSSGQVRRGRKIGTQEKPLETGYYDLLGVSVDATTDEIKKAYRRAAIKFHPDKNRDDPNAEEKFKEIAIAYQTLSDPALRKKYNEFGPRESAPEGGFVDPEEVFGAMFGGERFEPIIGRISLARDMKTALQEADDEGENAENAAERPRDAKGRVILSEKEKAAKEAKEKKVAEEKAAERAERVRKLVETLERKLAIFAEQATGPNDAEVARGWRQICTIEANELKSESYGTELLHTIGHTYTAKAKQHLATSTTFLGVGGWLHNVQGKYHVFSETVATVRAAMELKAVFDQIAAAEQAGKLTPDEKRKLEEQAAEKGLQALFKGTKLEIDSVLRDTCDAVLEDPTISPEKRRLRAVALQIMGEQYMAVRKDGEEDKEEADYVRVDTKASRARDQQAA